MKTIIINCIILSLFSCKPKLINQKTNKKEKVFGRTIFVDSAHYKSVGKYKNDDPIKKWCYYLDGKIIKKRSTQDTCYTKFYHQNGKMSRGTTVLDTSTKYAHWFYSGNWKFYDNKGKLIIERNYQSGKLASETILK
jgi:antitoxin component YwqK of YwqJK toxin-antitoxin module